MMGKDKKKFSNIANFAISQEKRKVTPYIRS
jgi:hypothetical protein